MKSIARIVEAHIEEVPLLEDFLARGLINQSSLARSLIPEIEKERGGKIKPAAVIMAVKRYVRTAQKKQYTAQINKVVAGCTLNLKSGIADIAIEKTEKLYILLNELSKKINTKKGEVLSVVQGISETAIIIDEKYVDELLKKLDKNSILKVERDLVELHIMAPPEFWTVSGIIYVVTKVLALHGINIIDIVTTLTELSILVKKEDTGKAFEVLNKLIEESK